MKNIVLGVTGSIAAYKALSLVRLWVKEGKQVRVIMTSSAAEFVAPLSFATLSKNDVFMDISDNETWNNHVELGVWADAFVVAPATASTLSKMASGQSDNMLLATFLSARCPVFFAPAMDLDMWKHPATQWNIERLKSYGFHLIPVGTGELASGLIGEGRMAEPDEIAAYLREYAKKKDDLSGKRVLITAGPTQEAIDPVRFMSNHSSGKMGIELANECHSRGAHVHLVLGPTHLTTIVDAKIVISKVQSARDMYEVCAQDFPDCDVAIFAAAVADYTPLKYADKKIKKSDEDLVIQLKRTTDIAGTLGKIKKKHQVTVGFALETHSEAKFARAKLNKKNFDLIVLNSLREKGAGFQHETNKVTIFNRNGDQHSFELKKKREVAADVTDAIVSLLKKNKG